MPTSPDKHLYHLVLEKEDFEKFDRLYPKLLKIFLNRCVHRASNDRTFFEDIFFGDVE